MKFILLLNVRNVKMPTTVSILTFINKINIQSETLKAGKVFTFLAFKLLRAVEIPCSVELSMKKKFYNFEVGLSAIDLEAGYLYYMA